MWRLQQKVTEPSGSKNLVRVGDPLPFPSSHPIPLLEGILMGDMEGPYGNGGPTIGGSWDMM